jgi:PilZ domain
MLDSLQASLKDLPDIALWAVPVIGGLVCGAAFLAGRRMLFPTPQPEAPAQVLMPGSVVYQGVSRDRRSAPRRKGNTVEVVMRVEEDRPHRRGWVIDRSIGGLCVMAEEGIAEGTVVRLRPRSSGETVPWTEVTIRACRKDGIHYELGCQFHRTPTWNLLLQFG